MLGLPLLKSLTFQYQCFCRSFVLRFNNMSSENAETTEESGYNYPNARPYQRKEVLEELYHEEGLTQTEIAEKFGVDQSTIHYHLKKHDLQKEQTRQNFYFYTFSDGKVSVRPSGDDEQSFYLHQLNACLNHDPHEVFAPENDVHHLMGLGHAIDLPENLEVIEHGKHVGDHQQERATVHPDSILFMAFGGIERPITELKQLTPRRRKFWEQELGTEANSGGEVNA